MRLVDGFPYRLTLLVAACAASLLHTPASIAEQAPPAQSSDGIVQGFEPGQRPPELAATDLKGTAQSLQAHQGEVVLLHFWATWCPYCRAEIKKLRQIQQDYASKGVVLLSVAIDDDAAKVEKFVADQSLPYAVIAEAKTGKPLSSQFQVSGLPTTFLIDRHGLVVNRFEGQADLISALRRLLAESPAPSTVSRLPSSGLQVAPN